MGDPELTVREMLVTMVSLQRPRLCMVCCGGGEGVGVFCEGGGWGGLEVLGWEVDCSGGFSDQMRCRK